MPSDKPRMLVPQGWSPRHWLNRVQMLARDCQTEDYRRDFGEWAEALAAEIEQRGELWATHLTPEPVMRNGRDITS